jgi:hypothetical protein
MNTDEEKKNRKRKKQGKGGSRKRETTGFHGKKHGWTLAST